MKYLVLMLMLGFGGLTGCSSDSDTSNETDAADQSDATDTSDPSDASDATDTSNACANEGFDAVAALSTIQVAESYAKLEGYSSETAPFDTKLTAAIIKTVDFVYSSIKVSKDNPRIRHFMHRAAA